MAITKMINEYGDQLVTIETAKLAFDAGFDENTPECYILMDKEDEDTYISDAWTGLVPDGYTFLYYRPTQNGLERWLRTKHNIHAQSRPVLHIKQVYVYAVINLPSMHYARRDEGETFNTFEEAREKALLESLKEVISQNKNKTNKS